MILGSDAAGVARRRHRGDRARGHRRPRGGRRRRDARPGRTLLSEMHPGHARRDGRGAAAQPRPQAGGAHLRGGVPADRVAHGVPDARSTKSGCASGTRCSCRAPAAASRPRRSCSADAMGFQRLGHEPRRGQARPRDRARRRTRRSRPAPACPTRVDAVIETVGEATWSHSLQALRPGGTVVVSGATSGPNPPADLARVFFLQLSVVGSTMGTRDELDAPRRLLVDTGVRPTVDATYAARRRPLGVRAARGRRRRRQGRPDEPLSAGRSADSSRGPPVPGDASDDGVRRCGRGDGPGPAGAR